MKLVRAPAGISFYESFSDLIFGTLCIFIVVVFGLVLKMKAAEKNLTEQAKEFVSPSKFSGGTDKTNMFCGYGKLNNTDYIYFFPVEHYVNETFTYPNQIMRGEFLNQIRRDAYLRVPVEKLTDFAQGFQGTEDNLEPITSDRIRRLVQEHYDGQSPNPSGLLELEWEQYLNRCWEKMEGFRAAPRNSPCLRFTTTEESSGRRFRVGDFEMSQVHFTNLLRSIKPGKGFFVEYVNKEGQPTAPPAWVKQGILAATGFDGRVLSEDGITLLKRAEREKGN